MNKKTSIIQKQQYEFSNFVRQYFKQRINKQIKQMSNIVTYQSLQIDSLVTVNVDYSAIQQNFVIMNEFIKSFTSFQKKFSEMQKVQRSLSEQVKQFRMVTEGQLTTMNEVIESRGQISKGKSNVASQQLADIKKSIKELRQFVAESTRQEHQAQEVRQRQAQMKAMGVQKQLLSLQQQSSLYQLTMSNLQQRLHQLSVTTATKHQLSDLMFKLQQQRISTASLQDYVTQIDKLLVDTKVQQFKTLIDTIEQQTKAELSQMRLKLSNKATITDVLKLEEMILGVTEAGFGQLERVMANKGETKKALVFLEKRINSLSFMLFGDNEDQREGIVTSKQIKCISCTKDLGQAQGKLDKVKNWSVFPVKQSIVKEKYAGFGSGFQSIIESTIAKKGGEVKYDEKGRMIEPFNLTGTIQGSLMKASLSQQRIQRSDSKSKNPSPSKGSHKYETSFMHQYGRQSNQEHNGINIKQDYYNRFRGLESFVMANKKVDCKTIQQGETIKL